MLRLKTILLYLAALMSFFTSINDNAAIIVGNPKGQITLTEVYDYQCPHCHHMYPIVKTLMKANPDVKVRLLPVAILNQRSIMEAAMAVASSRLPGKFAAFTNLAMTLPPLSTTEIQGLAQRLNLNNPKFIQRMHSKAVREQLLEGLATLKRFHTQGVPLFLIYPSNHPDNPQVFQGEQSLQALQRGINNAKIH